MSCRLIVTFRGSKVEIPLMPGTTVNSVKERVAVAVDPQANLNPADLKLMFKGKLLGNENHEEDLYEKLNGSKERSGNAIPKTFRLIMSGLSPAEAAKADVEFKSQQRLAPRVKDDLSDKSVRDTDERKRRGQIALQKAAARNTMSSASKKYGFGKIETLPGLAEEQTARDILEKLANDPGVLACMAKHHWYVGTLAELYPDGKVGQSPVCVMGLNENKGQCIRLRIRTDDLKGFRKVLSIRKVLFHELAHNVHSEHDGDFFLLMRQVEQECNQMDWTQGAGISSSTSYVDTNTASFQGGTFRLGGGTDHTTEASPRELAWRAAVVRMTQEEQEIEQNCPCGALQRNDLFLPKQTCNEDEKSATSSSKDDDAMDLSQ